MRIGLIVNPFAGLGGPAGLKGSDGAAIAAKARVLGAEPAAPGRARRAMSVLAALVPGTEVLTGPGALGADALAGLALRVGQADIGPPSATAADSCALAGRMADVDLLVFAGGDGTARDILSVGQGQQPMLGIPAGVKMQSAVFAHTPEAAGEVLARLATIPPSRWQLCEAEVLDIDEAALRRGVIAPRLHATARIPVAPDRLQRAKGRRPPASDAALRQAAAEIARTMPQGVLHLIGPGTSAGLVMQALGLEGTLLGVDAVLDGQCVAQDATARQLERLAEGRILRIVLGVTATQGFLLGRGNQQIAPALIRRAGRAGLVILAEEAKLAALPRPVLGVDTGDARLDHELAGHVRVVTAPGRMHLMRIGADA
jgi:predicted polyphosphate/ATP-dependent NAD kinase